MIGRIETFFRRIRRSISRSEWLVSACGLPIMNGDSDDSGIVMIQIDGLSHNEFRKALDAGELPFLKGLVEREDYRTHLHYSGMPSTTPAVQAEIFYGKRGAVPGFAFRDHRTGEHIRMYHPEAAARIEKELTEECGIPLATGGSSYSDIYTAGAAEPHFCPGDVGMRSVLAGVKARTMALVVAANLFAFVRLALLIILEIGLALADSIRGIIDGRNLYAELKFILARAGICILLRELIVIGVKLDLVRGMPIIHLNLLGYDEQAHRRGPDSKFAHWTLKGIDDAIERIWRASRRATRRDYDLWIYSDHGQERTQSYQDIHGRSLREAIADILRPSLLRAEPDFSGEDDSVRLTRSRSPLGGKRKSMPDIELDTDYGDSRFSMDALGPIGYVYPPRPLTADEIRDIAKRLVSKAEIPLVLAFTESDRLHAWTSDGEYAFPEEAGTILGEDHPFLEELRHDLVNVCRNPDSGSFMLLGWRKGMKPQTFAIENGSHGGAGPEETAGVAILPLDAPVGDFAEGRAYLRPNDLRRAAIRFLDRETRAPYGTGRISGTGTPPAVRPSFHRLRLMTYNVHGCVGMDGRLSPERIARVIARCAPDVVALQELDVGRPRSGGTDQAHRIAHLLKMDFHFHPAMQVEEERYGDAILTHLPMRLVKTGGLPGTAGKEPRGALWVAIQMEGREIQVINTHLGLGARERREQVEALLGDEWLGHPDCRSPVIFCGDLNARPSSPVCRAIGGRLNDAQSAVDGASRPLATFSSRFPKIRIDHVYVDEAVEVVAIEVPTSELARVGSDHLPLLADLKPR